MGDLNLKYAINSALAAFAAAISSRLDFGQVQIRRLAAGFELRHVADRPCEEASLELIAPRELRRLAQFTAGGAFRPLKSAPNLRTGWRALVADDPALGLALNDLYPGAVADWFAVQPGALGKPTPKITSYREFTQRQTGMYRITTRLDDDVAAAMARACCHKDFCLKRRLWTIAGSAPEPDSTSENSLGACFENTKHPLIPCLEPCAILLEFARKIARLEQQEKLRPAPAPGQAARLSDEAAAVLKNADATIAESDFEAPNNPRRLRFILEKQRMRGKPD